jgi:hypothetical protein
MRGAPQVGFGRDHLKDQIPDLLRRLLPSYSPSRPGDQTPVQAKTCTMPANDRLRIDEHEGLVVTENSIRVENAQVPHS